MRVLAPGAVLLLLAAPVAAAPITYDLTGTVDQSNVIGSQPAVSVGEQIPIVITLDPTFPQTAPGSGQYSFIGGDPTVGFIGPVISATFDGQNLRNVFQSITVSPTALSILTSGPQIGFGFRLDLQGTFDTVNGALPSTIDPASLTVGTFSVTEAFSPQADGYSGTINTAQPVPEPASVALFGGGLVGAGVWRLRRRKLSRSA